MYNESYHPMSKETLDGILNEGCWTASEQELIRERVNAATANKERNYTVKIDNTNEFTVTNGLVTSRRSNR